MSTLTNFLVTLGAHPKQSRLFQQAPNIVMNQTGLSMTEKAILTSQDLEQIQVAASSGLWDKLIAKGVIVLEPESENGDAADTAADKD